MSDNTWENRARGRQLIEDSKSYAFTTKIDKLIAWGCASTYAYNWQHGTISSGTQIKGFFIPIKDFSADHEVAKEYGIKVYFGYGASEYKSIVVGYDAKKQDMVPATPKDIATTSYKAYDFGVPCPSECGNANSLNGN